MAGLYFHIPFCKRKCIYCDFYSTENLNLIEDFFYAIKKEIYLYRDYSNQTKIETIYFGGGTPSLLSPNMLDEIFNYIFKTFSVNQDAEITIEVNPGTIDKNKLIEFKSIGINRINIGVQSFHQNELEFLGRIHNPEEARNAIQFVYEAGLKNVGIDLIYGIPNQTIEKWHQTLEETIIYKPQHISAYCLIIEKETPLARMIETKQVTKLSSEIDALMYESTIDRLTSEGYIHYEVSNFSLPGYECKHNLNYWNHTNYLGFGPSAHSFWNNRRWWNTPNLKLYCEKIGKGELPISGEEQLSENDLLEEYIMLGLRSTGIDISIIHRNWNIDFNNQLLPLINQFIQDKLATFENKVFKLTKKGLILCDEITGIFLAKLS